MPPDREDAAWGSVLRELLDSSHYVTAKNLAPMVDAALGRVGLGGQVFMADLPQRRLRPLPTTVEPAPTDLDVDGSVAGRAYQFVDIRPETDDAGRRLLWVPVVDGTERIGLLRVALGGRADDPTLRGWVWSVAGAVGHLVVSRLSSSNQLRRLRSGTGMTVAAELLWTMLPPRTLATRQVVVTGLLEPTTGVAGDAYDYTLDDESLTLAVFDGVGHDIGATQLTAVALAALRNARRKGITDLAELAGAADRALAAAGHRYRFVTALLADLDLSTGRLRYLLAGHPPPLLFRRGRFHSELAITPRLPLGLTPIAEPETGALDLEPDDRLIAYTDGITEARDRRGEEFGLEQLIAFTERAHRESLPAPETLRRLTAAVLGHCPELRDDATLVLVDWSEASVRALVVDQHRAD